MKHASTGPLLAGLLIALAGAQAHANGTPGFYAENADHLRDVPVHVVVLNRELRTQLPYGSSTYDPYMSGLLQNSINNSIASVPGLSMGQAMAAGAAGGLIAAAIIAGAERQAAKSAVEPADAVLRQAQCVLPDGTELARMLGEGVAKAPWLGQAAPRTAVLDEKQDVEDVVDPRSRRHVLTATYSMTPDFSTLVTSLNVDTYTDAVEGADPRWASRPVRSERLVVFSDQIQIPAKSAEDIEAAVAQEKERFATGPAAALITAANAGDMRARKKAAILVSAH